MARKRGFPIGRVLAVAIAAAALIWFGNGRWYNQNAVEEIRGVAVRRGPLRISVVERGNLKAADSVVLKSEIEGRSTILFLIDEGSHVEEGDVVCELDVTELIDRRFQREISERNAHASFVKSQQAYEIQKSQNESDIAKAVQNLEFAGSDLKQYVEATQPLEEKKAQEDLALAQGEFQRAKDTLEWTEKLAEKGIVTQMELEGDRLDLLASESRLEQRKRELDAMREFDFVKRKKELEANLEEAQRELARVRLQATARIVDYDAALETDEAKWNLEKDELNKLDQQIDKAVILAPKAGMVVYAKEEGHSRWGGGEPIEEGTEVRERQALITIPNTGGMIAEASLHESVLKQVEPGQPCTIQVDALPGREFQGRVDFVAMLADQNSWFANPNVRLYRTRIRIQDAIEEMRPGMSCSIEILVEDIEDTLFVPAQSIFRDGGANVCFVANGSADHQREVEVGRYNDKWIQVLGGLEEGEVVLLAAPPDFVPQAASEMDGEFPEARPGAPPGQGPELAQPRPGAGGERPAGMPGGGASGMGERGAPGMSGRERSEGLPRRPGGEAAGRQFTEEEIQKFREGMGRQLTEEEIQKFRERRQAGQGREGGGPRGRGEGSPRGGGDRPSGGGSPPDDSGSDS